MGGLVPIADALWNINIFVLGKTAVYIFKPQMDKTLKHSFPLCSLFWAGVAKSMKMHAFHDREHHSLIAREVVVSDNDKEGVANQCNETIMVEVLLSDSPIMNCDIKGSGKPQKL